MNQCFVHDPSFDRRADFGHYLNKQGLTGLAVEIGVFKGAFSAAFLDVWKGEKLYLVDPWTKLDTSEYNDPLNESHWDQVYNECRSNIQRHKSRAVIMEMKSVEAYSHISDLLDFVYLDGNHSYSNVKWDIENWWAKIRENGVLAGHDIFSVKHAGVTSAVAEFCLNNNLTAHVFRSHSEKGMNWYIVKGV